MVESSTKRRKAGNSLDRLRRLAIAGGDRALAELARRTVGDKHLRLDAFDGDDAPCHGYANCCQCPACKQRASKRPRRKS